MFRFIFLTFWFTLVFSTWLQTSYGENMSLNTSSSSFATDISQSLDLTGSQIIFVSDEVLAQTDLEELWIDDNQITEIPEDISRLIHLKRLSVYKNQLRMLPESLFNLTNLERINFSVNNLSSLSDNIWGQLRIRIIKHVKD